MLRTSNGSGHLFFTAAPQRALIGEGVGGTSDAQDALLGMHHHPPKAERLDNGDSRKPPGLLPIPEGGKDLDFFGLELFGQGTSPVMVFAPTIARFLFATIQGCYWLKPELVRARYMASDYLRRNLFLKVLRHGALNPAWI